MCVSKVSGAAVAVGVVVVAVFLALAGMAGG